MSRSAATVDEQEGSEFGSGIVVCLAKFSEHLWNRHYSRVMSTARWIEMSPSDRASREAEAKQYPHGDAARFIADSRIYGDGDAGTLSREIEMWMNGASDHFYDLDEKAPEPLKELAALALRIGHGFTGEIWTMEHVERIRDLWEQSCLAVDAMLGVKADWGAW